MDALRDWLFASAQERHRPPHTKGGGIAVFLTASTLNRQPLLASAARRNAFRDLLLGSAEELQVELLAWVVLREHYHAIAVPQSERTAAEWVKSVHRRSATHWNREEGIPGRQCWYEHWDRDLWTEGDVLSRVNYILGNPVKHGYVATPADWEWSTSQEWQLLACDPVVSRELARFPAPRKLPGDDF